MQNKIIGFLITTEKKEVEIDFFNVGLSKVEINWGAKWLYIWGIGNLSSCLINSSYYLSFPLSNNLLDRNVSIRLEENDIIIENDWLGSIPVFYNLKTNTISTLLNLCVSKNEKIIHKEGVYNFLNFGYSVFEQTIYEDVKFMRYYSLLRLNGQGIKVTYKPDIVAQNDFNKAPTNTTYVIEKLEKYVQHIEKSLNGCIIIPTSGGYDSRLLNYLIKDKKKIKAFTYGITREQTDSSEVVHAKTLCEILGIEWQQILLDNYFTYIDKWFDIYGASTHLHGMYHIEFYTKILRDNQLTQPTLLSGIIGDLWCTADKVPPINDYKSLTHLGYTHGINVDPKYFTFSTDASLSEEFYKKNNKELNLEEIRTILVGRTKIILLSYILNIPEYLGIPTWTPFLNFDNVKAILSLPYEERINRTWETNFFKLNGIYLENMNLKTSRKNELDYTISKNYTFEPLNMELLFPYIDKKKIKEMNARMKKHSSKSSLAHFLHSKSILLRMFKLMGYTDTEKIINEYIVIKALEKSLSI